MILYSRYSVYKQDVSTAVSTRERIDFGPLSVATLSVEDDHPQRRTCLRPKPKTSIASGPPPHRGPNVMFSKGEVFLIDFDWAGKKGEAQYPRNLSRQVKWPEKAEELEMKPIESNHDITMLDRLFSK